MRRRSRSWLVLLGVLPALSGMPVQAAPPQKADAAPQRKVRLFNIPAQPLRSALVSFGVVTGYQVIYDSRLAVSRRSNAVIGLFTPETALRMLLEGTDLTIRYTGPGDFALVSPAEQRGDEAEEAELGSSEPGGILVLDTLRIEVPPGAVERPDFSDYGRSVRLQIKRALGRSADTADQVYQVQFDLWVDQHGRIQRPRLLRSSGRAQLDAAIRHVIEMITLQSPPPPGMPLPVRVTIIAI